ncbi:MAG: hypothetical protein JRF02_00010 [Deltaproteobacteria bacterium]|jgi:hypothetical protein|nr:hypothetical protein [Deltaproteobacteria bacterium]
MDSFSGYRCWEIMNCDNLDCPARHEPKKPCWEIAKRVGSFHKVSKNCSDCLVYLLKTDASFLNMKKLKKLIIQKDIFKNFETPHQSCIL